MWLDFFYSHVRFEATVSKQTESIRHSLRLVGFIFIAKEIEDETLPNSSKLFSISGLYSKSRRLPLLSIQFTAFGVKSGFYSWNSFNFRFRHSLRQYSQRIYGFILCNCSFFGNFRNPPKYHA